MLRRILIKIFAKLASLVGVPEIQKRIDHLEQTSLQFVLQQQAFERLINKQTVESLADQTVAIRSHIDEVQKILTSLVLAHSETVSNQVRSEMDIRLQGLKDQLQSLDDSFSVRLSELSSQLVRHRRYIENVGISQQAETSVSRSSMAVTTSETPVISDALYVALEDHFRGSQDTVSERQRLYIPLVREAPIHSGYVLDLGCGRGEWLELLRSEGIDAQGLDSNLPCVEECRTKGLTVHHGDLLEHLKSTASESCCAVTLFQVFEHLHFSTLIDVMREIQRVLVPGGLLIGEVPNAENLTVASSTFWIDPTHNRPLFPGLLRFLAQESGFDRVDGLYSTPLRPVPDLSGIEPSVGNVLRDLYESLYGNADFALIAWV